MQYAVSAYIDACLSVARAHCEFRQRSFELCLAACETLIEPFMDSVLALLPESAAARAINSVTYSSFGDRAVIDATFPDHRARG